jgi:uncharacterized protein
MKMKFNMIIVSFVIACLTATSSYADTHARVGSTKSSANFQTAALFAKIVSDASDIKLSPAPHQSQMIVAQKVNQGEIEFSITNIAEATWSYRGEQAHKQPQKNIRLVANLNLFRTGLIAPKSLGIKNVSELKGRRVSGVFQPEPQLKLLMAAMLDAGNLTWDDVKPVPVTGIGNGYDVMEQGNVDAAIGAVGSSPILKINKTVGVRWLNFDKSTFNRKEYPGYYMVKIPANTSNDPSVVEEINIIEFPYTMIASTKTPDDVVYRATKAIWDSASIIEKDAFLSTFKKENMIRITNGIPLHPGAAKFYKEVGLLK